VTIAGFVIGVLVLLFAAAALLMWGASR